MNIQPKTRNQIYAISLIALAFIACAIYTFTSDGFCYERHNGIYCYQGNNLNFVGFSLLFSSVAIFGHLAELKLEHTISILKSSLSEAIFCFAIVLFGVAVFMAGPNA